MESLSVSTKHDQLDTEQTLMVRLHGAVYMFLSLHGVAHVSFA